MSRYLEEISKIPLLTREQEREVAGALTDAREELLSEYARIPEAVREVCRWARKAHDGEISFDRYFDFEDSAPRGKNGRPAFLTIVKRIERNLALLEGKRGAGDDPRRSGERGTPLPDRIVRDVLALHCTEPIISRAEERVLELLHERHVPLSVLRELGYVGPRARSNGNGSGRSKTGSKRGSGRKGSRKDRELEESLRRIRDARRKFEDSRRILTESNLRLAIAVAKNYRNRGLPLGDLIQEGNLGLIRACDRFDSRKGYRFSTYAVYWIRQSITRALPEQARTVRVPPHLTELLGRLMEARSRLHSTLGREPTDDELCEHLGVPMEKMLRVRSLPLEAFSIDHPLNDDGSGRTWEIPDRSSPSPLLDVQRARLQGAAQSLRKVLTPREAEIIGMRFGLCGYKQMTLEEIGRQFSVTRERVRQIQAEALKKLRSSHFALVGSYARISDGGSEFGSPSP